VAAFTLASFNTHCGVAAHRGAPRHGGPYDLLGALRTFDADVVVLQEVWRPDDGEAVVDSFVRELGAEIQEVSMGRAATDPWPHLTRGGIGTVGIAVVSRLPMRRVGTIPLGRPWGDPCRDRRALHVEIDVDGIPVQLVTLHTSSRLPHSPPLQLRRLRRELPVMTQAAVVTGDFNFWGPPVAALLPGWKRPVRGRTWPAKRPHSQIDHVLVRGLDAEGAEVLDGFGSDHRSIRVRLKV